MKILCILFFGWSLTHAQQGNPNAYQGGSITINIQSESTVLNPITSVDLYASIVQAYIVETLLTRNIDTWEWEPNLAESFKISKDKKTFTFTLREGIKWSDGKPITAEDVKFSFDTYFDDRFGRIRLRSYMSGINEQVKIIDKRTIQFEAKNTYHGNFSSLAGGILEILPKHIYGDPTKLKSLNKTIVGSGPYILSKYQKGKRIVLKKNPMWWGIEEARKKGLYNFNEIVMRFIKEESVAFEMLKKRDIDFYSLTPEQFIKKAVGKEWGKSVFKIKTQNKSANGYGFVAWNLLDPKFKDRQVRIALAHLMNRKLMIKKFKYGMDLEATGPWYQQSIYASPKVKPIPFDIKKALNLLRKAGWKDTDKDRILDKVIDGKKTKLSFTLLCPKKDYNKYLTIFKEDAKKAGVEINIKNIEWNSFVKLLDERKFEAVILQWSGGSIDIDPKQIWHSESAVAGGSNFNSYKNPKVDKLIDQARLEIESKKRIPLLQQVYEMIAEDAPYLFLFNNKYLLYGHTNKVDKPKETFLYNVGREYWWSVQK